MEHIKYTKDQQKVIDQPLIDALFVEGPASSGKTTAGIARLKRLLGETNSGKILILTPQKSLAKPYFNYLSCQNNFKGSLPKILTISGLARLMIAKFWLLISEDAGFKKPLEQPHFLSLETAQYIMGKIVQPFIQKGYFSSVTIERSRLFSQILDNLNKSSLVPFPAENIACRLKRTIGVDPSIALAFDQAQECALEFREYCLRNNILDFSLLIETFRRFVWENTTCRSFFYSSYDAIIADNVEEDFPVSHDLLALWLQNIPSATIIYDTDSGYRSFLGADPANAYLLKDLCRNSVSFKQSRAPDKSVESFRIALGKCIQYGKLEKVSTEMKGAFHIESYRFYPQMISEVCAKISELIHNRNTATEEIVILAPYLSDSVKFSLSQNLESAGIKHTAYRPSQIYINHPLIRALITIAKMAYNAWPFSISPLEMRNALVTIITDLDIARAELAVQTLFSVNEKTLRSFDSIQNSKMQERISFKIGGKIEDFRNWLLDNMQVEEEPLDIFFRRLFGELLSKKGFKLFEDLESAKIIHNLTQSLKSFRQFSIAYLDLEIKQINLEYIRTIEDGLLPSSFFDQAAEEEEGSVRIEPAHSFLMQNRACDYQFWLDAGSLGWWERLNQPLTNPYLLRRKQLDSTNWTDADEFHSNQASMHRVIQGLIRRCRKKVFISAVNINEYGNEHRGPLLQAIQDLQKHIFRLERPDCV